MSLNNSKPLQNCSPIPNLNLFKQIGEVNTDQPPNILMNLVTYRAICPHTHHQNGMVECKHMVELDLFFVREKVLSKCLEVF